MGDIDISVPECQAYLEYIQAFGQAVTGLMEDLQGAIARAGAVWRDDSIERARADAAQCTDNLGKAFAELQPVLQKMQEQIEWAVAGASM